MEGPLKAGQGGTNRFDQPCVVMSAGRRVLTEDLGCAPWFHAAISSVNAGFFVVFFNPVREHV